MSLGIFQATIVDEFGNVQGGAEVQVFDESTGLLAELFSDKLGTALDNPFFTSSDGFAEFYANNGEYRISAVKGLFSRTWRYVQIGDTAQRDTGTDFDQVPLNTNIVYPVATVADLRLLTGISVGQKFQLDGHTNQGVGGGVLTATKPHTTETDDNGYLFIVDGVVIERDCEPDDLKAEDFGAVDGLTIVSAINSAVDALPANGGTVSFSDHYSGIAEDLSILRNKVKLKGSGFNRLVFDSGYGLKLGYADLAASDKTTSTKVVSIILEDFHVTGETDYDGILTDFQYCDDVITRNFTSSPIDISSASGSLCIGLRVSWVQWWYDYNGYFTGNKAGVFWNFTDHSQDNEDHFHLNGTKIYLNKGLVTGEVCASNYVFFESGRVNGASEVSLNGVHIGEFASSGSDLSNAYGWVSDLDGTSNDRKIFRSIAFNSCMIEQFPTMFDLKTLNASGSGKDTSIYGFNETYFVGNSFATDYLFVSDSSKAFATFKSCEASSINTLFSGVRCRFEGRSDFSPYNTFSTNGLTTHDFIGNRPVAQLRTKRSTTQTLTSGSTTLTFAHLLDASPTKVDAMMPYNASWWVSSIDSTDVTLEFSASSGSNQSIRINMEIESGQ